MSGTTGLPYIRGLWSREPAYFKRLSWRSLNPFSVLCTSPILFAHSRTFADVEEIISRFLQSPLVILDFLLPSIEGGDHCLGFQQLPVLMVYFRANVY